MKLNPIYTQLLTETVGRNRIIDAIKQKRVVTIWYAGDFTEAKGYRTIEPFCYGVNKHGNAVVRAWQRAGVSDTPNGKPNDPLTAIPGWRMFRVDGMSNMTDYGHEKFSEPRPKYNPQDKDMVTIYAAAEFGTDDNTTELPPAPVSGTTAPQPGVSQPPIPQVGTPTTATVPTPPTGSPDKKQSMFAKFVDKFKNLVGYNTKY